jgi:serine/threonine protein phosphatase PrpC
MINDAVARTDIGRVRSRNEDSFLLDLHASLFAVADGMGGHAAGDVASQTATAAFASTFAETSSVMAAMHSANRAVIERATSHPEFSGMGTTMTAINIVGPTLFGAHVGDSRLYHWRKGTLEQLTRDHTVAQDRIDQGVLTKTAAMQHPLSSMLTRALGLQPKVEVDAIEAHVEVKDLLLLCSDGLTGFLNDQDLTELLDHSDDLQSIADRLVTTANERGGFDNITVLLVRV